MSQIGDKYYIDMRGIHAEGVVTENGFTVLAGSGVRNHLASYLAQAIAFTTADMRCKKQK